MYIALTIYGGGHYQRIAALCGGVCQFIARSALKQVTNALLHHRKDNIYMPTNSEMDDTSQRNLERSKLPRFALGVDGVMIRFEEAPRRIPPDKHQQLFWCRKQFYTINAMVIYDDKLIRDIDVGWPGSTHKSRI